MINFAARNFSNFYFHFKSIFLQDSRKIDQETRPNAVNNKNCHKSNFDVFLPQKSLFNIFFKTISHKKSDTSLSCPPLPPPEFQCCVWRCDCTCVDSSCHPGSLYLRQNITELRVRDIRICIYCTLSNVSKILTGSD